MANLLAYFNFQSILNPWVLFGFLGQFIFFVRFLVQWIATEKNKVVTIPLSFWWLSVIGTVIVLIYSIHIKDIVFTSAQILSFAIYGRNIAIEGRRKAALQEN